MVIDPAFIQPRLPLKSASRGVSAEVAPADAALALSSNPVEEYRVVCEFLRVYATLRLYRLALLLGSTGSIVTALLSSAFIGHLARAAWLKSGAAVMCTLFLVMEFRASSHWHALRDRANALAHALRFMPFPAASRWNPLSTSGAGFYLHAFVAALWLASVFVPIRPAP